MANCPLCKGVSRKAFSSVDFNMGTTDDAFTYHCCRSCGTYFIHPVPADIARYYPASYSPYDLPGPEDIETHAAREIHKLTLLRGLSPKGRLLEIGPGRGDFASLARTSGYDVETIEMDARCSRFIRDALHIPSVNTSDIRGAIESLESFDVIALWQVIEHLPNPREVLEAAVAKLRGNGVIVLSTPNPGSLQFGVFRKYWAHLDAPRHLSLVTVRCLKRVMGDLGCIPLMATTDDEGIAEFNQLNWWLWSLENALNDIFRSRRIRISGERINARTPAELRHPRLSWLARGLSWALYRSVLAPLERNDGKGAAYVAAFRKP